jgi:hypothetical protein
VRPAASRCASLRAAHALFAARRYGSHEPRAALANVDAGDLAVRCNARARRRYRALGLIQRAAGCDNSERPYERQRAHGRRHVRAPPVSRTR